ncbi:MAG: CinA family protein [Alphaproteobacteria bacterium]
MRDISLDLREVSETVLTLCRNQGLMLATAESCTGGLISAALTAIPGSSDVLERAFVTYTNTAKHEMLGVPLPLFETVGAVSQDVAAAMATGAKAHSNARIAVSVTGVAGPGASERKPAGLVYIGVAGSDDTVRVEECHFDGDRDAVRHAAALKALHMVLDAIDKGGRTAIA